MCVWGEGGGSRGEADWNNPQPVFAVERKISFISETICASLSFQRQHAPASELVSSTQALNVTLDILRVVWEGTF